MGPLIAEEGTGMVTALPGGIRLQGQSGPGASLRAGTGFLPFVSGPREAPAGAASHGDLHLKCQLGASLAMHRLDLWAGRDWCCCPDFLCTLLQVRVFR